MYMYNTVLLCPVCHHEGLYELLAMPVHKNVLSKPKLVQLSIQFYVHGIAPACTAGVYHWLYYHSTQYWTIQLHGLAMSIGVASPKIEVSLQHTHTINLCLYV